MGQSDMAGGSTRRGLGSSVAPAIASSNRDHCCPFSIHGSCDRANVAVDHADPARALQPELAAQFGRWPVWSALVAVGGYLTWVVIYSEATVQARRRRALPRHPASAALGSEETASSPPQEQIPT